MLETETQQPVQRSGDSQGSTIPRRFGTALLMALLVALIFGAGYVLGSGISPENLLGQYVPGAAPVTESEDDDVDFSVFWEVWNTVENRFYYDMPGEEIRVQGAINGLVESLGDPHTGYVTPEGAEFMRERLAGAFEGIGATVETDTETGGVYIIRVFEDSPAEEAGILAGDVLIEADSTDLTELTLDEGIQLIRGEAGTDVVLTVYREGEQELLRITVTRGTIELPTVDSRMIDDKVGYVALFDFYSRATSSTETAIEDLIDEGAEVIIFDLRGNGGGYLVQGIDVADLFLDRGIVTIQRDVDGNYREYTTGNGELAEDIPLVVLVNENSASASEIVAGALQDRDRAILIGTQTFGKGSVQTLYDLSDGSILRITTGNWYTPNDRSISEEGITPDIIVELEAGEVITTDNDPQLDRALDYIQEELLEQAQLTQ